MKCKQSWDFEMQQYQDLEVPRSLDRRSTQFLQQIGHFPAQVLITSLSVLLAT